MCMSPTAIFTADFGKLVLEASQSRARKPAGGGMWSHRPTDLKTTEHGGLTL